MESLGAHNEGVQFRCVPVGLELARKAGDWSEKFKGDPELNESRISTTNVPVKTPLESL